MKSHVKKKAYRAAIKQLAMKGFANNATGQMVQKSYLADNSMKRDYYPQRVA